MMTRRFVLPLLLFVSGLLGVAFPVVAKGQSVPDRFQPDPTGGTYDTVTGITWGFSLIDCDQYLGTPGSLRSWDWAMSLLLFGTEIDSDGVEQGVLVPYADFSEDYWGVRYDDWRLPTKSEMLEAFQAGLFEFHELAPGVPGSTAWSFGGTGNCWTSTQGKKVRGGFDSAYIVNLFTGESQLISANSALVRSIAVRGGSPPDDSAGGGNGKGKK